MKSGMVKAVGVLLLLAVIGGLFFWIGKKSATQKFTRMSQFTGKYLIEQDVTCANGKQLGKIAFDLDVTPQHWYWHHDTLVLVRNDPGKYPSCVLP